MKSIYVETSILSYLTARPSRDLVATARQHLTRAWWETRRVQFDLFVSPLVRQEASRGDPEAARLRIEALGDIPMLEAVEEAFVLAQAFILKAAVPSSAEDDAAHIAIAAAHGMDYLMT